MRKRIKKNTLLSFREKIKATVCIATSLTIIAVSTLVGLGAI